MIDSQSRVGDLALRSRGPNQPSAPLLGPPPQQPTASACSILVAAQGRRSCGGAVDDRTIRQESATDVCRRRSRKGVCGLWPTQAQLWCASAATIPVNAFRAPIAATSVCATHWLDRPVWSTVQLVGICRQNSHVCRQCSSWCKTALRWSCGAIALAAAA